MHIQTTPNSIFHGTNDEFAVQYRTGSILTTQTYRTRDEAWGEFMTQGRNPDADGVRFITR